MEWAELKAEKSEKSGISRMLDMYVVALILTENGIKVVLHRSPRFPDIHDLNECNRLYDLGRHIEQP